MHMLVSMYYCIYMFSYGPYGPEIKHYYYYYYYYCNNIRSGLPTTAIIMHSIFCYRPNCNERRAVMDFAKYSISSLIHICMAQQNPKIFNSIDVGTYWSTTPDLCTLYGC